MPNCPTQIEECHQKFDTIIDKLDKLNERLFIDNGNPSLQSKVNKNRTIIKTVVKTLVFIGIWVMGIIAYIIRGWIVK